MTTAIHNTATSAMNAMSEGAAGELNAEFMMLQVQMLLAKDFDEQMRKVGEQIKFLSDVKKSMRENINKVQQFLAKNSSTHKDNRTFMEAAAGEINTMLSSMQQPSYNLDQMELTWSAMTISYNGDKHNLDTALKADGTPWVPDHDGTASCGDLASYFGAIESGQGFQPLSREAMEVKVKDEFKKGGITAQNLPNYEELVSDHVDVKMRQQENSNPNMELAKLAEDKNSGLPFYHDSKDGKFDDGTPKFRVFKESIENMLEQMRGYLEDIDADSEELSTKLSQLTNQRKTALDGANQLRSKMDEIRSNTVNKLDK